MCCIMTTCFRLACMELRVPESYFLSLYKLKMPVTIPIMLFSKHSKNIIKILCCSFPNIFICLYKNISIYDIKNNYKLFKDDQSVIIILEVC